MDKGFNLCTEWCLNEGLYHGHNPKERGQLFVKALRKVLGLNETEKIKGFSIEYNSTAKKLGCSYLGEDGGMTADKGLSACFKWRKI